MQDQRGDDGERHDDRQFSDELFTVAVHRGPSRVSDTEWVQTNRIAS
jgi:hypothetical protein